MRPPAPTPSGGEQVVTSRCRSGRVWGLLMAADAWELIHAERAALAHDLTRSGEEQWARASLCSDGSVHQTLGHIVATTTMTPARFVSRFTRAGFNFTRFNADNVARNTGATPAATLSDFRAHLGERTSPPRAGGHLDRGDRPPRRRHPPSPGHTSADADPDGAAGRRLLPGIQSDCRREAPHRRAHLAGHRHRLGPRHRPGDHRSVAVAGAGHDRPAAALEDLTGEGVDL